MDGRLFFGIGMGLLSVMGLTLAANAIDDIMFGVGFAFFGFGVLSQFGLINRSVGQPDQDADNADVEGHADDHGTVPEVQPATPADGLAKDTDRTEHADRATG